MIAINFDTDIRPLLADYSYAEAGTKDQTIELKDGYSLHFEGRYIVPEEQFEPETGYRWADTDFFIESITLYDPDGEPVEQNLADIGAQIELYYC